MKALVCGGRGFTDAKFVYQKLDEAGVTEVVTGGAPGADHIAVTWCFHRKVPYTEFRADWRRHGRSAGPIRNQRMLDEGKPEVVIAFPGGKGTADMKRRAKQHGVRVVDFAMETQKAP